MDAEGPDGHGSDTIRRLVRVCRLAVEVIAVDGAGVTVAGDDAGGADGYRDQPAAVGASTRLLEDLQLTVGEGAALDAHATGWPVLVPDLALEVSRWPGFAPQALRAGVRAVFSLPLQVGAVGLGTLDLHRTRAGPLTAEQYADTLVLVSSATETLLATADRTLPHDALPDGLVRDDAGPASWLPHVHADVHVASGMVSAQTGLSITAALLRIRAHAFAHDRSVDEIARRVVRRDLVLGTTTDGHGDDHGPRAPDPETTP